MVDSTRFESAASAPAAQILSSKQTATDSPNNTLVAGSVVGAGVAVGGGVSVGTAVGSGLGDPPQAATAKIVTPINTTIITLSMGKIIKILLCYS